MTLLNDWISEELLKALGWTLVHALWQLIMVAGILWIALRLVKKSSPALKYGLAVSALVFSFLLTLATFAYEWSQIESNPVFTLSETEFILASSTAISQDLTWESRIVQATAWIDRNLPILVNFWFFGSLLFLFRLFNSLSEVRNLRKSASLIQDFELEKITYRLMGKLNINRRVQLRSSSFAQSPLTFGTVKPVILLPAALIFQLTPLQLEAIIAHELAHVKRNDYLSNLLLSGLEILFFFHPCYWWMSQTVKELRENAADDLALKIGIEPKVLASSLAEVLNFAKQNPPELALAAGEKRNPTLLRIKRMLGYPTENYPQTPIISIPMLLTLFLSAGLMASAQQDAPKPIEPVIQKSNASLIEPAFAPLSVTDTIPEKPKTAPSAPKDVKVYGKNVMVFSSGDGYEYKIKGDTLITGGDTIILSGRSKDALMKLRQLDKSGIPTLELPMAPNFPVLAFADAPMPSFEFEMNGVPAMPLLDMKEFPMLLDPKDRLMVVPFDGNIPGFQFRTDTTKMTPEEQKQWAEKMKTWSAEMEKRSEEWAARWKENAAEREAKIEAWKKEMEPKMKEFEQKMKEWQEAQGPKMKDFEEKMKAWQEAQEPKMKEFELKMKEWEATQKPKLEEFQKKMEAWQKEHQARLEEFQKLLREELKKDDN
jgi:beta-lactamase regulating signal transducer with metallopeptidase domain